MDLFSKDVSVEAEFFKEGNFFVWRGIVWMELFDGTRFIRLNLAFLSIER